MALVLGGGLGVVAVGLALGLAGAVTATRFLGGFLYGVSPLDVATFAGVTLLLLAVATVAMLVPARRAASVDPARSLRRE